MNKPHSIANQVKDNDGNWKKIYFIAGPVYLSWSNIKGQWCSIKRDSVRHFRQSKEGEDPDVTHLITHWGNSFKVHFPYREVHMLLTGEDIEDHFDT